MKERQGKLSIFSMTENLQFPDDFLKGNILVQIHGQEKVIIENFRGISSYTEEEVKLFTRKKKICVAGSNLKIDSYTKDEIEISGCIERLEYE